MALQATTQIINLLATGGSPHLFAALTDVVTKWGSVEDAQLLLPYFLQTKNEQLLKPLQQHGDARLAATLFNHAIEKGQLKEAFPYETLVALSYLQHAETEAVLINYYKGLFNKNLHWDLHVAVCLSLLNYPCKGYEALIKAEIEKCLDQWLFPEMIPALAMKTGDAAMADRLYHHGSTKASSDASAGLILGLALFGEAKRELFKTIIFNPEWEAGSTGTGNVNHTLMGMSYLNITIAELFADIKALAPAESERMRQHVFLLSNLLQEKMQRTVPYDVRAIPLHPEPYAQVYEALFEPADGSGIFEITGKYITEQWLKDSIIQEFEHLQELCKLKMAHEAELKVFTQG